MVQGNDRRLKDATVNTKGIVELADDGEEKSGTAVQSIDRRLKEATTDSKGIIELAENGEDRPGVAVQGNDRRLKDATVRSKGIIRLAEDGEDKPDTAVQGNDRRLKDATVHTKGIVELAEDGEQKSETAVQGSDSRLKPAAENREGIVRFAKSGEIKKGSAVQADDIRLSDAREPLNHEHDYASVHHDFNSHSGTITISGEMNERFSGITPPPSGSAVIHSENKSNEAGSAGIAGIAGAFSSDGAGAYGVIGHSRHIGVRGQSAGNEKAKGCGVLGISRFGAGGVFSSEHDYSIVADGSGSLKGYDGSVDLKGSGRALYADGDSVFKGKIEIRKKDTEQHFPVNFAEYFEVDGDEFLSPGDILVTSEKGLSILAKSSAPFSRNVIGVISGNPSIVINNSGAETKIYPVALAGKTLCRVDARKRPINPGDLIVTSETSGCGMSGKIDSFDRIGSVIGKALDSMKDGIGLIPVFITHK